MASILRDQNQPQNFVGSQSRNPGALTVSNNESVMQSTGNVSQSSVNVSRPKLNIATITHDLFQNSTAQQHNISHEAAEQVPNVSENITAANQPQTSTKQTTSQNETQNMSQQSLAEFDEFLAEYAKCRRENNLNEMSGDFTNDEYFNYPPMFYYPFHPQSVFDPNWNTYQYGSNSFSRPPRAAANFQQIGLICWILPPSLHVSRYVNPYAYHPYDASQMENFAPPRAGYRTTGYQDVSSLCDEWISNYLSMFDDPNQLHWFSPN